MFTHWLHKPLETAGTIHKILVDDLIFANVYAIEKVGPHSSK
jgi:hypothetical protein